MGQSSNRLFKVGAITVLACVGGLAVVGSLVIAIGILTTEPSDFIKPMIVYSPGPVSVEHARAACPAAIEFPDAAKNIQYASYSCLQAKLDYVKFEAPLAECVVAAERILSGGSVRAAPPTTQPGKEGSVLQRLVRGTAEGTLEDGGNADEAMADTPFVVDELLLSAPWFDPQNIRDGFTGGTLRPESENRLDRRGARHSLLPVHALASNARLPHSGHRSGVARRS